MDNGGDESEIIDKLDFHNQLIRLRNLSFNEKDIMFQETLRTDSEIESEKVTLKALIKKNPIGLLSRDTKEILFKFRNRYCKISKALPLFLRSIDWANPQQVIECHKMLKKWKQMNPEECLILLSDKYIDQDIRKYAVYLLSRLEIDKFAFYTPQLTQALLYEDYHQSDLCDLMLRRALENPYTVGHKFFWYMKSNLHVLVSYERYSIIIEQF